jgi:CRP/FNR family transcriptional regulator, anaerobic regulatory protein
MAPSELDKVPFFNGISKETRQQLAGHARRVEYAKGQTILLEGEEGRPVYFVLEGSVRAYRSNTEGREQTLTYLKPGGTFNLPAVFSSRRNAPASAVAAEETSLVEIEGEAFREIALRYPEFARKVMQELADRLSYFSELVHDVYFALRDEKGQYRGTLEVSQEVKHIRKLQGERRLLEY